MTSRTEKIIIGVGVVAALGLCGIGFLVGAAVVGWKVAQRAGNEAATQQGLKTIAAVEIQYYNTHDRTFGTLDQVIKEKMLTSKFSGTPPAADGYVFVLNITPKTSSQPSSYTLNADPQRDDTGGKHYYIDSSSSMIHFNPDQPAGGTDPSPGG